MYKIEKTDFGFKLTFGGNIKEDEMSQWVDESRKALIGSPLQFGVFVDMRTLKPLNPEAQKMMEEGQKLYKSKGMQRSVVIVESVTISMQFKRIAKQTGIYDWERYISAQESPNWENLGLRWIRNSIDPDK
jgi:hypothetical protein